ncbi:MAG: tyrosine recombinase XerC [Clostridiales bacterium]|nr:tyrosine recombinase XerC [Clostridiales bacterium]
MGDIPPVMRSFLTYLETIRGKSPLTVEEYALDLRTFFRFLLRHRGMVEAKTPFEEIPILSVDEALLRSVTLQDFYEFLFYLSRERQAEARTRARKVSCLKSFFKYCTNHLHVLDSSPADTLEAPKTPSSLPIHLSLEESVRLLEAVEGRHVARDYAILTLFLNCGIRLSELVGLNLSSINLQEQVMRVVGKGSKERVLYLNAACVEALRAYLRVRPADGVAQPHRDAVFLSGQKRRISNSMVQKMVQHNLVRAGLSGRSFSAHKLRHTAATLMFSEGVDVRTLKEVLGHEQLNTTQIYTHVSNQQMKQALSQNPLATVRKKKAPPSPAPPPDTELEP